MNKYGILDILKDVDEEFEFIPFNEYFNDTFIGCKDIRSLEDNYVSYCSNSFLKQMICDDLDLNDFLKNIPKKSLIISDTKIFKDYCNLIYTKNPRYVFALVIKIFKNNYNDNRIKFGKNFEIGQNCILKNCIIGNDVTIGDNVVIGGPGFGYVKNSDGTKIVNFQHYGKVIIKDNVTIHSLVAIDRGTLNDTIIEEGCKIDNLCHIAHNVTIGKNTMASARTLIGGGTKIGENCWLGAGCTIIDRISISDNSFIGSGTNVTKSIIDPNGTWVGNPARRIK